MKYQDQLKSKKWKNLSEQLKEKANWQCEKCQSVDQPLVVHHLNYVKGRKAWQYHESLLQVLCDECHEDSHRCDWCSESFHHNSNECPNLGVNCLRCGITLDKETIFLWDEIYCCDCGYSINKNAEINKVIELSSSECLATYCSY